MSITPLAKRRVFAALPWTVLESILTTSSSIVTLLVVVRLVGPQEYGRAAIALSVALTVGIFSAAGLPDALTKCRSSHRAVIDTVFWTMTIFGVCGFLICCMLALPLAMAYRDPSLSVLIAVLGLSCITDGLAGVPSALLIRKMRARQLLNRTLVGKLATFAVSLFLAAIGLGAWAVVIGYLTGSFLACATLWWLQPRLPRLFFSYQELRPLLRFGWMLSLETIIWFMAGRVFLLTLGYFHGAQVLGYFSLAMRVVEEFGRLLNGVLGKYAFSIFGAIERSGAGVSIALLRGLHITSGVTTPVFAGFALVAPDLIPLVLGLKWQPSVPIIQIFSCQMIIYFWIVLDWPLLRIVGKQNLLVMWAFAAFAIYMAGLFLTVHKDLNAAALAFSAPIVLTAPVFIILTSIYAGVSVLQRFRTMLPCLIGTIVMVSAVIAIRQWLHDVVVVEVLFFCVAGGAFVYCTVLAAIDRVLVRSLISLIRRAAP